MEYIKFAKKSIKTLAGRASVGLRVHGSQTEVTDQHKKKPSATSLEGLFRDLIAMRSVTGNYEENHAALEYVDQYLRRRGMHVKRFTFNGVESLVATTRRTKQPKVMFMGHLDVVAGEDELFTLREKDGKYFGRGTYDMKFAVAAFLKAIDELDDLKAYDLGIMIETDEETGGLNGTKRLAEMGYLPQVMIVPDGGENWDIETFCKGTWFATIHLQGRTAHGSRPWEGDSATHRLLALLQDIRQLFPQKAHKDSTINVGLIEGGEVVNQLAAEATAQIDIRFGSLHDTEELPNRINQLCKKAGATITTGIFYTPTITDPNDPLIVSFRQSVQKITGKQPGEVLSYGGNDSKYFSDQGVTCIVVRPKGGGAHAADEWISKAGLEETKNILKDYANREARVNTKPVDTK